MKNLLERDKMTAINSYDLEHLDGIPYLVIKHKKSGDHHRIKHKKNGKIYITRILNPRFFIKKKLPNGQEYLRCKRCGTEYMKF